MNQQPISKRYFSRDGLLEVHSIFYTIQGEGPFAGTPAVFVRLAGCNLQCPGCDTEYTPNHTPNTFCPLLVLNEIQVAFNGRGGYRPLVVITGGEPFRQNILPLVQLLTSTGMYFVQVESNGTLPPGNDVTELAFNQDTSYRKGVYVVVSPKTPKIHPFWERAACGFKYVLDHKSMACDGLPVEVLNNKVPTKVYRQKPPALRPIYLQPMDHGAGLLVRVGPNQLREENSLSLEAVKQSCLRYGYILQLQIHKIIGVA